MHSVSPILDHFVDSNILISSLIYWEPPYDRARVYIYENGTLKHTSFNVFDECRRVMIRYEEVIPDFILEIEECQDIDYSDIDPDVAYAVNQSWVEEFADQYTENNTSLDDRKKRAIISFARYNKDDIAKFLIGEYTKEWYIDKLEDVIRLAKNNLDKICDPEQPVVNRYKTFKRISEYQVMYRDELEALFRHIDNQSDILILMDSYHVCSQIIQRCMLFVTMDRGDILINKPHIERAINGITVGSLP